MNPSLRLLSALFCFLLYSQMGLAQTEWSMQFDGLDDKIIVGDSTAFQISGQATIEFWLYLEELGPDLKLLVSKEGEYNIGVSKEGNISWAFANISPGWNWHYSSTPLSLYTWYHVAVRYDLDYIDLFINGILVQSIPSFGMVGDNDADRNTLIIGDREQDMFNDPFNGKMDEFRLWDIARSDIQINTTMTTKLTGEESGLIVYYRFDETDKSCDVVNCTTNEYHGTRLGETGPNNLPQYDSDTPFLMDVPQQAVNACLISSVEDLNAVSGVTMTPNPASDYINITIDEAKLPRWEGQRFLILNASGNVALEWPLQAGLTQIPANLLPNGVYALRISGPSEIQALRFVILK